VAARKGEKPKKEDFLIDAIKGTPHEREYYRRRVVPWIGGWCNWSMNSPLEQVVKDLRRGASSRIARRNYCFDCQEIVRITYTPRIRRTEGKRQ
jgi:hypothetical protein